MTKIEAIQKVMEDNGGTASLELIYENICKYYPTAKDSDKWDAGIRGVLYRAIREKKGFKKIGLSIYALEDYKEEEKPTTKDAVRMHSYIEGICIELGNYNGYDTFTADPSALYRDNLQLKNFITLSELPAFSYPQILHEAKRIDVVWFNKKGLAFPQRVFEVVDSVNTLNGAFNRSLQLRNFRTEFFIVAPEKHREKYNQTIELETYQENSERFTFVNYDEIQNLYESTMRTKKLESKIFGK
ncbi:MAG: hypothetical protein IJ158_14560 [Treponema sp.]|nr:hypothetical protein [Treponema sp.]